MEFLIIGFYIALSIVFFVGILKGIKEFQKAIQGVLGAFNGLANNLSSYPSVEAEVIESVLAECKTNDNGDAKLNPVVVFSYEVNGRNYVANNKKISIKTSNQQDANELVKTYAVGDKLQVHYNPKNPQEAYLKHDLDRIQHATAIFNNTKDVVEYKPIHCSGCGSRISIKDSVCKYCENPVF